MNQNLVILHLIIYLSNNVFNIINKTRNQKPNETGSGVKKSSMTTVPVNNSTLNFTPTNSNVPVGSNISRPQAITLYLSSAIVST